MLETWHFHQTQTRPRQDQNQEKNSGSTWTCPGTLWFDLKPNLNLYLVRLELVQVLYGSTLNLTLTLTWSSDRTYKSNHTRTQTSCFYFQQFTTIQVCLWGTVARLYDLQSYLATAVPLRNRSFVRMKNTTMSSKGLG